MSQAIVINRCFGGFGLSEIGALRYLQLAGKQCWPEPGMLNGRPNAVLGLTYWLVPPSPERDAFRDRPSGNWATMTMDERKAYNERWQASVFYARDLKRDDPLLVQVVEELGDEASDRLAKLEVVYIPDGVTWEIEEYDGTEWISEKHRRWP